DRCGKESDEDPRRYLDRAGGGQQAGVAVLSFVVLRNWRSFPELMTFHPWLETPVWPRRLDHCDPGDGSVRDHVRVRAVIAGHPPQAEPVAIGGVVAVASERPDPRRRRRGPSK